MKRPNWINLKFKELKQIKVKLNDWNNWSNSTVPQKRGRVRYPLVDNLLHQVIFFSYLTVSFSHYAVPISHVTVIFSHLVVPLLFFSSYLTDPSLHCAVPTSHVTVLFSHLVVPFLFLTFDSFILTLCNSNITCDKSSNITCDSSFVTFDGFLTFFFTFDGPIPTKVPPNVRTIQLNVILVLSNVTIEPSFARKEKLNHQTWQKYSHMWFLVLHNLKMVPLNVRKNTSTIERGKCTVLSILAHLIKLRKDRFG